MNVFSKYRKWMCIMYEFEIILKLIYLFFTITLLFYLYY